MEADQETQDSVHKDGAPTVLDQETRTQIPDEKKQTLEEITSETKTKARTKRPQT